MRAAAAVWRGRTAKTERLDWARGGRAHRSRECVLTVAQQSQWRANKLGLGCVLSNFDGTTASGATRRDLLISTSQQAAMDRDRMFAADSLQHGSVRWASRRRRGTSTTATIQGAAVASASSHSRQHQLLAGHD